MPESGATPFGWTGPGPLPHHAYVFPALRAMLGERPRRILDVGCGNGHLSGLLAQAGHDVTGLDSDSAGIQLARSALPAMDFRAGSAYDDFRGLGKDFDAVVASELIEHLAEPGRFLRNAFEVLPQGGIIVLTTPYHGYFKNLAISLLNGWDRHFHPGKPGGHVKFFSKRTLSALLAEASFADARFSRVGRFPPLWKSMVCRAVKP